MATERARRRRHNERHSVTGVATRASAVDPNGLENDKKTKKTCSKDKKIELHGALVVCGVIILLIKRSLSET